MTFQLGDEKYAVISRQGPTLCFDPPVNYTRDNISEKVRIYLFITFEYLINKNAAPSLQMQVKRRTFSSDQEKLLLCKC